MKPPSMYKRRLTAARTKKLTLSKKLTAAQTKRLTAARTKKLTLSKKLTAVRTKQRFTTSLTKIELIRTLRNKYIALGHGTYESHDYFVVPKNVVILFVSRSSRYLPQSVVSPEFYSYFGSPYRNYSSTSINVPQVLDDRYERTYGPGERVANLYLNFRDPQWPGMGLHRLPIAQGTFKTTPGKYAGLRGTLKELVQQGPGVYFIVACRAIVGQSEKEFSQLKTVHYYPPFPSILGGQVRLQNEISQSLRKRRRISPGISRIKSKKPRTVMNDLISRFSTALRI